MDEIDTSLLRLIQDDASQALVTLGKQVGLSAAAVQRRLGKLRRSGVIDRTVAILDQRKVGLPVTVVVFVECDRDDTDSTARLKRRSNECPEVVLCYELTGSTDFVAILAVTDLDQYKTISASVFDDDPNIRRFESHIVLDTVVAQSALPIPTPGNAPNS